VSACELFESEANAPIDPIENIQRTIYAKRNDIVASESFSLPSEVKHVQLREDGDRLEEYGERPQDIHEPKYMVNK
jgi:hypothetical protein